MRLGLIYRTVCPAPGPSMLYFDRLITCGCCIWPSKNVAYIGIMKMQTNVIINLKYKNVK